MIIKCTVGILLVFITASFQEGFKWVSLGDSITNQDGKKYGQGDRKGEIAKGYQTLIANHLGPNVVLDNRGRSGAPLTGKKNSVLEDALSYDFSNKDLITIAVGTNDFKLNKPIGDFKKTDSTFSGSYRLLIEHIRSKNKKARIIVFTPLHRNNDNYTSSSTNKVGHKLSDYIAAILRIKKMYKLELVDMYNKSGINDDNLNLFTMDGLHPNDEGYKKMAELFLKEVNLTP